MLLCGKCGKIITNLTELGSHLDCKEKQSKVITPEIEQLKAEFRCIYHELLDGINGKNLDRATAALDRLSILSAE